MHFNWKLSSMLKLCLSILLAAFLQNVECRPAEGAANATASEKSNLFVGNTSSSNVTRAGSFVSQLGNVEKQIDETLEAISPYLHFMLNPDSDSEDDDECVDQMIIQLVPQYITPKEIKEFEDEAEEQRKQNEKSNLQANGDQKKDYVPRNGDVDNISDSSDSSEESDDRGDQEEIVPLYDEYYPKYKVATPDVI